MIVDLFLVYSFLRRLTTPFSEWDACKLGIIDEQGNILKKRSQLATREERAAFGVFDTLVLKLKRLLEKVPGGATRIGSYAAALWLIREHGVLTASADSELLESSDLNEWVSEQQLQEITEQLDSIIESSICKSPRGYYTGSDSAVNNLVNMILSEGTTVKTILRDIGEPHLVALSNGGGYFYFEYDDPVHRVWETHSEPVNSLNQLSREQWVRIGKAFVAEVKRKKGLREDGGVAIVNTVAGGAVAGLGVGPQGEPGVSVLQPKKKRSALLRRKPLSRVVKEQMLNEVFNSPYSVTWVKNDADSMIGRFQTSTGQHMRMDFEHNIFSKSDASCWEITFASTDERGGSSWFMATGGGDSYRIFATVMDGLKKLIREHQPTIMRFTADKEFPGSGEESREKLYAVMVQKFARSAGYDFKMESTKEGTEFTLKARS